MNLRAAYLSMHRQTDMNASKHGITANQFVLLMLLAEEDGISQKDLVERAFSDPNTIRAMLVLLEKRGLIERDQHPEDGRKLNVTITAQGRQIYRKVSDENESMLRKIQALFSEEEIQKLTIFLDTISQAMAQSDKYEKWRKAEKKLLENRT